MAAIVSVVANQSSIATAKPERTPQNETKTSNAEDADKVKLYAQSSTKTHNQYSAQARAGAIKINPASFAAIGQESKDKGELAQEVKRLRK